MHRRTLSSRAARAGAVIAAAALVAVATSAAPASAADREYVLTHGHVDGFEVTYDADAGQLVLSVKDDTRIYSESPVFRDPADVTLAYQDEQALITLPPATGNWAFLGEYGGQTVWAGTQTGSDQTYVPWVGWSTERLNGTLTGTGVVPAAGSPVSLDVEIDGPGDVFSFMNDAFGVPINRYVDTTTAAANIIPVSANAHVHTNWLFTAEGDYEFLVTPSLATADGGTVTGPTASYHFRIGAESHGGEPIETTLSISGASSEPYQVGDIVTLVAVQDPPTGEDHYHWFEKKADADDFSVVPGALTDTLAFTAEADHDGSQFYVALYDHDHDVIAQSEPVTIQVEDDGGPVDPGGVSQEVRFSLAAEQGALVVSVDPEDRVVDLGELELGVDGDRWVGAGELRPVTVTDTRSGAPGWTASGQLTDFESGAGSLEARHLGWVPLVVSAGAGQQVVAGGPVDSGFAAGDGLGVARVLASSPAGSSLGTAVLGGQVLLEAPTTLQVGQYTALLTLTAI